MRPRLVLLCAASLALAACGGTKLVREPSPVTPLDHPIAAAADATLAVDLDFVIVRNGPGAWARNGDWDEYLLEVRNTSASPIEIRSVNVTDSSGFTAVQLADRAELVQASKRAAKRYRNAGIKISAGRAGAGMVAAGVGAGVVGYGAAVAAGTSAALGAGGAAGGGAAAAAGGFILAAPVLMGVGIARMVNNSKVDDRIESRATPMPARVPGGGEVVLDVFFPISPSPRQVTIRYGDSQGDHQLVLDTRQALHGLHLATPDAPVP